MSKIQKRHCDYCGKYYERRGVYFCSTKCRHAWRKEQPNTPITKLFWSKVTITDLFECWIWNASTDHCGYGMFTVDGKRKRTHRIAYEFSYGKIPEGKLVCHHCDTPACVNPLHLWLGTQQDNMTDMVSKKRQSALKGENNGRSKLTETKVLAIRALHTQGMRQIDIAKQFDVAPSCIWRIVSRKQWKHI